MNSSRIFVRGLPPNITNDEFRRHFATNAAITDAKVLPNRRIGYVGYPTPMDAAKAVQFYNKSYIRSSRLSTELARPVRTSKHDEIPDAKGLISGLIDKESSWLPRSLQARQ